MKYIITEEIESPTKVSKGIEIFDFFFLLGWFAVSFMISNLVHPSFKLMFFIFSMLIGLFLTSKSLFNKRRRNYESIIILLKSESAVYFPYQKEGGRSETKKEK